MARWAVALLVACLSLAGLADPAIGQVLGNPVPVTVAASGTSAGPVAWWKLGEGTGTTVPDSSGHDHLLTLASRASWDSDSSVAPPRVWLRLSNPDPSLQPPYSDGAFVDTTTAFSVSAWVRPGTVRGSYQSAVSVAGKVWSAAALQLNDRNRWAFVVNRSDSRLIDPRSGAMYAESQQPVQPGKWVHLVGVYDKSGSNTMTLYVDGVRAAQVANPWKWPEPAAGPWLIGGEKQGSVFGSLFTGSVREVRIYDYALNADQAAALYNQGAWGPADLAAQWPLDEGSGTTAADWSGNQHDLTLRGGASWATGKDEPVAMKLDGNGQYAASAGPAVNTGASFTVTAWAMPAAVQTKENQSIASQDGNVNSGFNLMKTDSGQWALSRSKGDQAGRQAVRATSPGKAEAGRWAFLAGAYDKAAGKLILYVDGKLAASAGDAPGWDATGPVNAGRVKYAGGLTDYWDGRIRDVRLYPAPLTSGQIQQVYDQGKAQAYAPAPQELGVNPCEPGCAPLGFDAVATLMRPHLTTLMRARPGSKWTLEFAVAKAGAADPTETGRVEGVASGSVASWVPATYLAENTKWVFRVRAMDSHGWGPWSYNFPFTAKMSPPDIPVITSTAFKAKRWGNPESGEISWRSPSPEIEGYSFQRDDGAWSEFKDITSTKLTGLEAGWHYFRVKARNHAGKESPVASFGFGVGPEPLKFPDLDGDGAADVIVSTSARLAGSEDARLPGEKGGSVLIIPGGGTLPGKPPALIHQHMPGLIPATPDHWDDFGASIAYGDFAGNGHTDIAIGVPGKTVGKHHQAGEVIVLYGTPDPPYVKAGKETFFNAGIVKLPGGAEDDDEFGISLAAARFRGSGYTGLAIGVPGHTVDGKRRAGAVVLLHGGPDGLTADGSETLDARSWAQSGHGPEAGARFGWSLAAGNVTGSGPADLAVLAQGPGSPGDAAVPAGTVYLARGQFHKNLDPVTGDTGVLTAAQAGVTGHLRQVVIGTFHGGDNADLVITADQRTGTARYSGALVQVRGTADGLDPHCVKIMSFAVPGQPGMAPNGFFGGALAAGTLPGSRTEDLAVAGLGADRFAGSVTVLAGGPDGIFSLPPLTVTARDPDIGGPSAPYDGFGYGLAIQPADKSGTARLLVTAPQDAGDSSAGSLYVMEATVGGSGPRLAGSTRYSATQLGGDSLFSPAWPLAGGITTGTDIDQVPLRYRMPARGAGHDHMDGN